MFDENLKLVHEVETIASRKGVTPAQIALGWIVAQSGKKGMPEVLPIPGATTSARVTENVKPAKLTDDDMVALQEILERIPVQGERYHAEGMKVLGV